MMTKQEWLGKRQIMDILRKQGYPTYAYLLDFFDVHLTDNPNVIGALNLETGEIILNKGLDIDQVSVIVRHEILHEYLSHMKRMQRHIGDDAFNARTAAEHNMMNMAGDYEISNRGYTEADKRNVRRIKLNGQTLSGLVTEDDHPEWVDLSIEDMYDELKKEYDKQKQEIEDDLEKDSQKRSDEYVAAYNEAIKKYGSLSAEEIAKVAKELGISLEAMGA